MPRRRIAHHEILSGWKDIANYLGKGVRTIQRYERELSLPIRRPAGRPMGSVIATKVEIDAWIKARPLREAFTLSRSTVDNARHLQEFHRNIAESHKLREETAKLRSDLSALREALRESVEMLHDRLRLILPEDPAARRLTADATIFDPKRKVN